MIKAAVRSAIANTTLEPHFIYDGEPDELTEWLENNGVTVIYHRVSFYNKIEENFLPESLHIPSGAYLRCDIPALNSEDEYVLYTDCDVIFLRDVNFENIPKPKFFACSSQFNKRDFADFNTGVMVMNLPSLRKSYDKFIEFICSNISTLNVFDQSAYQIFYGIKNTPLDIKFNHKPYWGVDNDAAIVHFHGAKPIDFTSEQKICSLSQSAIKLFYKNPAAYKNYLEIFKTYSPEIVYDYKSIEKLINKKILFNATQKTPLKIRIRNFVRKRVNFLLNLINLNKH